MLSRVGLGFLPGCKAVALGREATANRAGWEVRITDSGHEEKPTFFQFPL